MKIKRILIERITIVGNYKDKQKALDYSEEGKYRITRAGPRRLSGLKFSQSEFEYVMEREFKNGR